MSPQIRIALLPVFLLVVVTCPAQSSQNPLPGQKDVLAAMRLANSYFMKKWPDPGKEIVTNVARPSHIWTRGVYYEGLMALYSIDIDKSYYDYAVDWGVKHQWMPRNGITDRNADDQCCGQTWIDLFGIDSVQDRVTNIKACIDNMVKSEKCDDWNWVDAIQMSMPVFTQLGVLYRDSSYFRKMYDLYHYTKTKHGTRGLYNADEHLWWRDKDFVPPYKEPNGQNCYWSRGNGWVLAALVRVLSLLPLNDPHRAEYLQDYLDMVKALVPLQRADGFWNPSLRDSTDFGGKELTGTALFTYGMAWGIRQGFLDKKSYAPIVARSWNALVKDCLHPDGMLGWVQGTGKQPKDGQPLSYDKIPDFEDYGLGCFLLAGSEIYQIAQAPAANLDETKVPPYEEPDPLRGKDGKQIATAKEWERVQRPMIYHLFEKEVYGRIPTRRIPVTYTDIKTDESAMGGLAIKKEVTIRFLSTDTAAKLRMVIYLPRTTGMGASGGNVGAKAKPVPVFVGYSFGGNGTLETAPQWPLKEILARGYGVASAWYWDLEPDRPEGWQTGIRTRLSQALDIQPYEWSAISAWAWGLERMADYLLTDKAVDGKRLIVIGHSRLGKTAVWAGASDPRFAMVVSNESGEGGAALSKRDYGETIAIISDKFPFWFSPAYKKYGNHTDALPFDQHWLLSLMAPRPMYVASAEGDQWSDPRGEYLSAQRAGAVYQLYKENGVGTGEMPQIGKPVGDFIRYHIRAGKHDITPFDWEQYMDLADKRLKH
jgi:rhamnogalacturonyl hydrolase YesR